MRTGLFCALACGVLLLGANPAHAAGATPQTPATPAVDQPLQAPAAQAPDLKLSATPLAQWANLVTSSLAVGAAEQLLARNRRERRKARRQRKRQHQKARRQRKRQHQKARRQRKRQQNRRARNRARYNRNRRVRDHARYNRNRRVRHGTVHRPPVARRHRCPAGHHWSGLQRRCLRSCRAGWYYSYVTGSCRRRGRYYRACPAGAYWNHSLRRCITRRTCPPGHFYSYALGRCKRLRTHCAYGWRYSPYKRRCVPRCSAGWGWNGTSCLPPARKCGRGWRWNAYYKRCVRNRVCPAGTSWNGYRCVSWRRCAPGHYWSIAQRRCRPKVASCPFGYRYRPGWGCVRRCGAGWHWAANRCVRNARACPAGRFWSAARRRCVPNCRPGTYWSYRRHRCVRSRW